MEKKKLKQYEKLLIEAQENLKGELKQIEESSLNRSLKEKSGDLSGYAYHMADVGTDTFDAEMALDLASTETGRLWLIEEALERIKEGTYGNCLRCSEHIDSQRLKVLPYARFCIKCQEELEKKRSERQ